MSDNGSIFQQAISKVGEVFTSLTQQAINSTKNQNNPNTQTQRGLQLRNDKLQPNHQSTAIQGIQSIGTTAMTQLGTIMGNLSLHNQNSVTQALAQPDLKSGTKVLPKSINAHMRNTRPQTQPQDFSNLAKKFDDLETSKPLSEQGKLSSERPKIFNNIHKDMGQYPEKSQLYPNHYNWAQQTSHMAANASSNKSVESMTPETCRQKILTRLRSDPIDRWYGQQNLYSFLVLNTDAHLKSMRLTKAETAYALSSIFKSSSYAMDEAQRISMLTLPDQVKSLEDRKSTYKAIARTLDNGTKAVFTPLKPGERLMDLFQRTKLTFECERNFGPGLSPQWIEERLNYLAIEKISSHEVVLVPEHYLFYIGNWWMNYQIINQLNIANASEPPTISTHTITNMLKNLDKYRRSRMISDEYEITETHSENSLMTSSHQSQNYQEQQCDLCYNIGHRPRSCPLLEHGPCEICLENGKLKHQIFHITENHNYDSDSEPIVQDEE